ncbi:PREDICTED: NACHT, LRR and PYD domains-containing protein 10-like [Propithecus coquereli]|uniref:NACHT, LRR and PYD domains-containing protein 10-like n=1 Tax=Propithecus coquereli TaxID=379532 RepID=UPI00063EE159|nr:PREDICTED: NACHT, LRR and PYD domains-containing protein 10-like [Propithecus coquereli]
MVLASDPQNALLWALSELEENNFKILKFHLRGMALPEGQPHLARGELEGLSRVDLASKLILTYGAREAVRVVLKALKVMNLLELVDQLSLICLNDYRQIYREHVCCPQKRKEGEVDSSYRQLLLVAKPSSGSPESSVCPILEQELDSVVVEALFGFGEKPYPAPFLVVLQGSAGTGKTTLAKKMVLDWATGTLYPGRFDYVFYVSCKEVVLLPKGKIEQLLVWCCEDSQAPVTEILRQPERLLFILDGFDELQRPFEKQLKKRSSSPKEDVLHLLIRRRILPTCSLLITTRPQALQNLEPLLNGACHVRILGFSKFYSFRHISFQEFFHAMSYLVTQDQSRLGEASRREMKRLLQVQDPEGNKEMTLSVQFLLDMSRKESSSYLELMFGLRFPPCLMQDLKHIKEQVESLKRKRSWDLELSLNTSKIKKAIKGIRMPDVFFKKRHANERKSHSSKSFSVKTSLDNGQKEEPKRPLVGAQKEVSHGKVRGAEEPDEEVGSSSLGSRETAPPALEGQMSGGMEGTEDGERQTASKTG